MSIMLPLERYRQNEKSKDVLGLIECAASLDYKRPCIKKGKKQNKTTNKITQRGILIGTLVNVSIFANQLQQTQ